jgi:hypothetical protein
MERRRFDPLTWPTRLALAGLGATLVLDVVAVVSDVSYHRLIQRLVTGGDVSLAEAQAADDRQFTIGDVQLALLALTALAFVLWFYRAYENLRPLGIEHLRWGSGWAIGSWFVPLLNLVRPKSIANDIWRGSDPDRPELDRPSGHVPWWHHLWWGLFIVDVIFARVAYQTFDQAPTLNERADDASLLIASDSLGIAAAAAAIVVVFATTRRQRRRAASLRAL